METNLETDSCPVDLSRKSHIRYGPLNSDIHSGDGGNNKIDFDNRCESGYKSVDEAYYSGSVCSSISDKILESEENESRVQNVIVDSDKENAIQSIDEGISSINLSTELLQERLQSPKTVHSKRELDLREKLCENAYRQDEDGDTNLHTSIIQLLETLSLHLIGIAIDPDYLSIRNNYLQTPLHLAVITKQPLLVRKLIAAGAEVDVRDHYGNTPLHIACKEGEPLIVRLFLQPVTHEETKSNNYKFPQRPIPQNLEARNYDGQVCLHLAAENGNCKILHDLISQGANINARDGKSGRTILHYAAESGDEALVQFLLSQATIDVNSETYGGLTPIKLAKGRCHTEIIKMLRDKGAYDCYDDSSEEEMETDGSPEDFVIDGKPVSRTRN